MNDMKRTGSIICLVFFMYIADAQPRQFPPHRMDRDEIIKMQTEDIISCMDFDKRTEDRFVEVYSAFRKEIDKIAGKARPPQDNSSESEIEKAIQQNFFVSEQILNIRKKYYLKFREFMKPSQIQMMYHIENEAGRRMHGAPDAPDDPGRPMGPGERPMPLHHE